MSRQLVHFTDAQWHAMCDAGLGMPQSLARADLARTFVYDRRWGVFPCESGYHQAAMGLLLAFHHGKVNRLEVAQKLGIADREHLFAIAEAVLTGDAKRALEVIDAISSQGIDFGHFTRQCRCQKLAAV